MRLEDIDPDRLIEIAKSGSIIAMTNALLNIAKAIRRHRATTNQRTEGNEMIEHTKEPWTLDDDLACIVSANGSQIADPYMAFSKDGKLLPLDEREATARRIVVCVNACAGLPNAQLAVLDIAESLDQADAAWQQRDELLAALKALMRMDVKGHQLQDRLQFSSAGRAYLNQYAAVIAKIEAAK
jgi:hypothetical protein